MQSSNSREIMVLAILAIAAVIVMGMGAYIIMSVQAVQSQIPLNQISSAQGLVTAFVVNKQAPELMQTSVR